MAKDLNKWLDEFVKNGVDASDVVNWPENAGGGGNEVIIDTTYTTYTIDPVELAKLTSLMGDCGNGSIGDCCKIDGSGGKDIGSIVYLKHWNHTYSLQIRSNTIFSIDGDHFTSWSDHISEHATEISAEEIIVGDGEVFVGIIRMDGHSPIQSFDISKLLIKKEQEQESTQE